MLKLNIQLFGGRGASSGNNKTITYKSTGGEKRDVKLNGTFLRDLKEIGLEQVRGKEFNSRVEMFSYVEKLLPRGASVDRRTSRIFYKGADNKSAFMDSYDLITYKDRKTKKIGITMIGGGSYKDKDGMSRYIRYF